MPIGLGTLLLLAGAGSAASAAGSAISNNRNRESQEELTRERIASDERMQGRDLLLKESMANPFRHQAAQAATLAALDHLERSRYSPVRLSAPARYAGYVPELSGGFSYERSPEVTASAGALKRDVMAGHRAPSVVPPGLAGPPVQVPTRRGREMGLETRGADGAPVEESAVLNLLHVLYGDSLPTPRPPAGRGAGPSGLHARPRSPRAR